MYFYVSSSIDHWDRALSHLRWCIHCLTYTSAISFRSPLLLSASRRRRSLSLRSLSFPRRRRCSSPRRRRLCLLVESFIARRASYNHFILFIFSHVATISSQSSSQHNNSTAAQHKSSVILLGGSQGRSRGCLTTYLIGGQCSFLKHRNLTGARPIPTYCDSRRVDQRTSRLTIHRQGLRPSGSCIGRATSRTEHNTGVLLLTQEDSR